MFLQRFAPAGNAWVLIFFRICFGVSVNLIELESTVADIFDPGPCKLSKNLAWIRDGFVKLN
jgi:hypothetical protein